MNKESASNKRTITVRGAAHLSVRPDYVNVLMTCKTRDLDYAVCMSQSAEAIDSLKKALAAVQVDAEDLKTTNFNVETQYDWIADGYGNSKRKVFRGYVVTHDLKLGFDFDAKRLSSILAVVAKSKVDPEFKVDFTVKDPTAIKDALFAKASVNARRIAEALCQGAGTRLGDILAINYSWQEIEVYNQVCSNAGGVFAGSARCAPEINPDDIDASDSVTFVWELL